MLEHQLLGRPHSQPQYHGPGPHPVRSLPSLPYPHPVTTRSGPFRTHAAAAFRSHPHVLLRHECDKDHSALPRSILESLVPLLRSGGVASLTFANSAATPTSTSMVNISMPEAAPSASDQQGKPERLFPGFLPTPTRRHNQHSLPKLAQKGEGGASLSNIALMCALSNSPCGLLPGRQPNSQRNFPIGYTALLSTLHQTEQTSAHSDKLQWRLRRF